MTKNKTKTSKTAPTTKTRPATTKSAPKKSPPKKDKTAYRITNWPDYNAALVTRGSVTVWLSEDVLASWGSTQRPPKGSKGGHPKTYSDVAIQAALTIREVYSLTYRATEGFVSSLLVMMGTTVKCPDYTTLSYRAETVPVTLSHAAKAALAAGEALHIAVDSTGVKVYGEGEWKVRKHGWSRHRTWRKVHLGVSVSGPSKHLIVSDEMTTNGVGDGDGQLLPTLLNQMTAELPDTPLADLYGDGGYDTRGCYEAITAHGAVSIIPPQKNAKIWQHGNTKAERLPRDQNLRRIRAIGRKAWKREIGYHARSLSETAMFRFKTLFGHGLSNRQFETQRIQTKIRIQAMNTMTLLGMPASVKIEVVNSPTG
jgi:Transposase DDE domain